MLRVSTMRVIVERSMMQKLKRVGLNYTCHDVSECGGGAFTHNHTDRD